MAALRTFRVVLKVFDRKGSEVRDNKQMDLKTVLITCTPIWIGDVAAVHLDLEWWNSSCMQPTRPSDSASVVPSRRLDEFREGVTAGRHPAAAGDDSDRCWAFETENNSAPRLSSGVPY